MSVASSVPCIKIPTCSSSQSSLSSSSSSSTSSYFFRFSSSKPYNSIITIRNSQTEGPLRRPVAPPLREPLKPTPPSLSSPSPPAPPSTAPPLQRAAPAVVADDKNVITLEFQRQKAKELQEYFKQKKLEEANQGPSFGFIGKNEINNGSCTDKGHFGVALADIGNRNWGQIVSTRWAMFGFAVGMLTEYATGSDFVDQVKILLSNFGIIDLE